jgi:hypothetical protein
MGVVSEANGVAPQLLQQRAHALQVCSRMLTYARACAAHSPASTPASAHVCSRMRAHALQARVWRQESVFVGGVCVAAYEYLQARMLTYADVC